MVAVSQQREDAGAIEMWRYIWELVDILGPNGMSDEEDDEEYLQGDDDDGFRKTPILKVLQSEWRNKYFNVIFTRLDKLPRVEERIFRLYGKPRIPRYRVDQVSGRKAPPYLPRSFFAPSFLKKMPGYKQRDLKMREEPFLLREVQFED